MKQLHNQFGVVDNRFLARSIGLLDPHPPLTISEDTPIRTALELLQNNRVGSVVVTDDEGLILGIFTERDVVLKVSLAGLDLDATPVSQVMTLEPKTQEMTSSIAYCLNMMSQGGYRHIPIVDEQSLPVGMVSVKDIVDYIVRELTKDLEQL